MMHKFVIVLGFMSVFIAACKSGGTTPTPTPDPVSTIIKKVWVVGTVSQNGTQVYPSSANLYPGYASYKLDLSAAPAVTLVEVDGTTFSGTYSVPTNASLALSGLTPVPSGTTGALNYSITKATSSELVITNSVASPKTGNMINVYTLIPKN